jgi:DNA-binding transcriptional LysR family regulator
MIRIEGLSAFTAIADAGSVSAAAKRLGISKSVASERLTELEREVGARLVQRTTRKLSLTEDGHAFLARARRIVAEVQDGLNEMSERRGELAGPLRLSGPVAFGTLHLGPALYPFLLQHPAISLTLDLDDRFVDIAADGYDAVIRHGPVSGGRLAARRLASSWRMLVASPDYLARHGAPKSVDDLRCHRAILFSHREADWRFAAEQGAIVVRPERALRVNNGLVLRDAAMAGLGVALVATFLVYEQLRTGELTVLDVGAAPEATEISVAYPKERSASAKLLALTEHLHGAFGDPPYWEGHSAAVSSQR